MSRVPPRVTIVHTSFLAVADLDALFAELGPDVALRHVVDDSLLPSVLDHGGVTPEVEERLLACFRSASVAGCDVVFSQCSSVGEVADRAARDGLNVVKIDAPMAERACALGPRVAVIATLETTLAPTQRLIEDTARRLGLRVGQALAQSEAGTERVSSEGPGATSGQEIIVEPHLVAGAFACLSSGDREKHDALVREAIGALSRSADVIVCAQGSMARVAEQLVDLEVPVLTSARTGVQNAIDVARRRCRAAVAS